MKNFIVILAALHVSLFLLQGGFISTSASSVDDYPEDDYSDESKTDVQYMPITGIDRPKNKDADSDKQLVLAFPLIHKRKPDTRKQQYMFCVPRGRNCDHRPKQCCHSGSCRCNVWGGNCKCQRKGFFRDN